MSSNKSAKRALIRRYGNICFIERLHLRDIKEQKYTSHNQYKRMKQLTYHHIKMRKDGGEATLENGALLSEENHLWFHQQSKEIQTAMNEMFQKLKRKIDCKECKVELVDDIEYPFELNLIELNIDKNGKFNGKSLIDENKRKERRKMQKIKKEWEDR